MNFSWSNYHKVVILTGAGISAASGIKTFRDSGGLWENHRIEDVATPEAFHTDPAHVWRFYSLRRKNAGLSKPNKAHFVLDEFASVFKGEVIHITQNVDGLHTRAQKTGFLDPICMHGTLEQSRCTHCQHIWFDDTIWLGEEFPQSSGMLTDSQKASPESLTQYEIHTNNDGLPLSPCCGELLRPHIVWFGEEPLFMTRILQELEKCDLFLSIGTSGMVYPAAAFLGIAKSNNATTGVLNLESLSDRHNIDFFIQGEAEQTLPKFFKLT